MSGSAASTLVWSALDMGGLPCLTWEVWIATAWTVGVLHYTETTFDVWMSWTMKDNLETYIDTLK